MYEWRWQSRVEENKWKLKSMKPNLNHKLMKKKNLKQCEEQ